MSQEKFHPSSTDELREFRQLADGLATLEEFARIEARLATDPAYRGRYVRFMDLEATLYEVVASDLESEPRPPVIRTQSHPYRWGAAGMAVAAALIAVATLPWWRGRAQQVVAEPGPAVPQFGYVGSELKGLRDAAIVIHSDGIADTGDGAVPRAGTRLRPGVLTLKQGSIRLLFLKGAEVVVHGPAVLHVLSAEAATLVSGRAAARVPEEARGFVLNAPETAVVDLGTEFALSVDDHGKSEVHVVEGEVEVSQLGDDGNTLRSERVEQSRTVRVGASDAGLERVDKPGTTVPPIEAIPKAPLLVSHQYVADVKAHRPLIYWRFEEVRDGKSPNEMGPAHSAVVHDESADQSLVEIKDGVARFSAGNSIRYITADGAVPELNAESFTMEMWVQPDRLQNATLLATIPEGEVWSSFYLNVLELANQTPMVHSPGSFRFLHRHPPNLGGGLNLFSNAGCTPGLWHHIVAVKTPGELKLYLNGSLSKRLTGKIGSDHLAYHLLLGQLRLRNELLRQLVGSIDEFAIYLHALSDEDIQRHSELLTAPLKADLARSN